MILAIVSQKGGVGKTTTAAMIAAGLARKRRHVLLVDLDAQCNLSLAVGAMDCLYTVKDVLIGAATAQEAVKEIGEYAVIPGSEGLTTLELASADAVKTALGPVADLYDFIVLDTPPHLSMITLNALTAAQAAIVTLQADLFSLQSLTALSDTLTSRAGDNKPRLGDFRASGEPLQRTFHIPKIGCGADSAGGPFAGYHGI